MNARTPAAPAARTRWPWRPLVAALAVSLTSALAGAALAPAALGQAAQAAALLQAGQATRVDLGTAFCIDRAGRYLTTAHAVDWVRSASYQLTIASPGDGQRTFAARVIQIDPQLNLAVLQIDGAGDLRPLPLGDGELPAAGTSLTMLECPLRSRRRANDVQFDPVVANACRVADPRGEARDQTRIACDANPSWNQSGAPVLDDSGTVIGVVESVVIGPKPGATLIPTARVRRFLQKPQVTLATASLPYARRHERNEVVVRVTSLTSPLPRYEVELTVQPPGGHRQTLDATAAGDGVCTFALVPVPASAARPTTLTARFAQGSVTGEFVDRQIRVGGRTVSLRDVRRVERAVQAAESSVTLAGGETLRGPVAGLEAVVLDLGVGPAAGVDLSRSHSISIEDPDFSAASIQYVVRATLDNVEVGRAEGRIELTGAPAALLQRPVAVTRNETVAVMRTAPARPSVIPPGLAQTPLAGGSGGGPIVLCASQPRDVVGFKYELAVWRQKGIVRTLEPIYDRASAPLDGTVLARGGYVVGGILADSDAYFHAFRVIFVRLDGAALRPADTYMSDWIGEPSSGEPPKKLAGRGEHVVGVCGRKGLNMDAVGLVVRN